MHIIVSLDASAPIPRHEAYDFQLTSFPANKETSMSRPIKIRCAHKELCLRYVASGTSVENPLGRPELPSETLRTTVVANSARSWRIGQQFRAKDLSDPWEPRTRDSGEGICAAPLRQLGSNAPRCVIRAEQPLLSALHIWSKAFLGCRTSLHIQKGPQLCRWHIVCPSNTLVRCAPFVFLISSQ